MKTDTGFQRLFSELPETFFLLLGKKKSLAKQYRFESPEVKEKSYRIDGVMIPKRKTLPVIIIEVQFQVDKRIYERALSETLIFRAKHQEYPKSQIVVIFPRRAVDKGAGMLAPLVESGLIRVVYLNEATKDELHDAGLLLLRLISSGSNFTEDKETVQRLKQTIHELPKAGAHREFLIDFLCVYF
jgi:predicted transposase/invertase (TIGR01784 family)